MDLNFGECHETPLLDCSLPFDSRGGQPWLAWIGRRSVNQDAGFRRSPDEVLVASLLLAPEIPAELGRIQGAAIAMTGLDKAERGTPPEFVAIILPGDSNILRLMWRALPLMIASGHGSANPKWRIETTSRFEAIDEVEGVALYRMKRRERKTEAG